MWAPVAIAFLLAITCPLAAQQNPAPPSTWAASLYRQLDTAGLDPDRIYRIRDAAIDREDLHLRLEDGVIGFTRAVDGRITGALFEGTGEILLIPPDRVERWSLNSFTGAAILEERFTSAYLRFNDDTFDQLQPSLRPAEEPQEFIDKWSTTFDALAHNLSLRLLQTFVNEFNSAPGVSSSYVRDPEDRVLLARITGLRFGMFDIMYDSLAAEQIIVSRLTQVQERWYNDLWTSFPARSRRTAATADKANRTSSATIANQVGAEAFLADPLHIDRYKMQVQVLVPRTLAVDATLDLQASRPVGRFIAFELSRFLHVSEVTANGDPVEVIQNQALRGTELERRGNDVLAVILPRSLKVGEKVQLHFSYKGDVMAEAGGGLMYVGPHGTWYPNRGLALSNFDMEFRYPNGWTLVATGKRTDPSTKSDTGQQISRWISERPIPFAGFNLGQYEKETAKAGDVVVEAYATRGVESTMRQRSTVIVVPTTRPGFLGGAELIDSSPAPSPASNASRVAREGARTIDFYSRRIGPYPYTSLALTQMPGTDSQSWPGLVYLSSYVYLTPEERSAARMPPAANLIYQRLMQQHEIGHQWWGNLLVWKSYREQWIIEALSNYCALLQLESEDEGKFRLIMDQYREELLSKNAQGVEVAEAGPVTLGVRLNSSRFPNGYNVISYGRGTWLFHMLRTMLLNHSSSALDTRGTPEEPFYRVLRKLREQFEGKEITTRDIQKAFEEELPPDLRYENRRSLDWFFDTWVNGTSIPHLSVTDVKFSSKTGPTIVTGKIVVKEAADGLVTSVPVYATVQGTSLFIGRVFADGSETSFRFTVPPRVKRIVLDPHHTILSRP